MSPAVENEAVGNARSVFRPALQRQKLINVKS